MSFRALLAASALITALLPAGAARAYDGPGCGSPPNTPYNKTASCVFALRGSPIIVQGDSSGSSASVHVFVKLSGYPELPPLFECTATGTSFASCERGYPDDTTSQNIPPQVSTVYLVCNVQGSGLGAYWCQSGAR